MFPKISLKTFVYLYQKYSKNILQEVNFDKESSENSTVKLMIKVKICKINYILLNKENYEQEREKNKLHLHAQLDVENNLNEQVRTHIIRYRYVGGARTLVVSW